MSNLYSLERRLGSLKGERESCRSQLSVQRKRLDKVENITWQLNRECGDKYDDLNVSLRKLAENLVEAIVLNAMFSARGGEMERSQKEQPGESDNQLGQAFDRLQAENRDIRNRIADLEGNIRRLDSEIWSVEEEIKKEKKRIREREEAERAERARQAAAQLAEQLARAAGGGRK